MGMFSILGKNGNKEGKLNLTNTQKTLLDVTPLQHRKRLSIYERQKSRKQPERQGKYGQQYFYKDNSIY